MILFLSSLFSGILGGMGIGGGTILIPVLTFFTDYTQQQIQGINLIYFIPSATMAVIIHLKKGNIEKKIIKPIVFSSVPACVLGAFLAMLISGNILRKMFAVFLILIGIGEIFKNNARK